MRKIFLLLGLLLIPTLGLCQGARYDSVVLNNRGNPVPNATITVCTSAGTGTPCVPLAVIGTSRTVLTGGTNPFTADANGNWGFWAAPGAYVVTITSPQISPGFTQTLTLACEPSSACTHTGAETFKNFENIRFVDTANSQGWSGTDIGAWVNSAIANLPTVSGAPAGQIYLFSLGQQTITQATTITLSSPFVSVIGPGSEQLILSCTMVGDCWNTQVTSLFSFSRRRISGFTLLGPGSVNPNAVGMHTGNSINTQFYDIEVDNFLGTNSSCWLFDNITGGFFERNILFNVSAGIHQQVQSGCTRNFRWTNTGNTSATSSFGHNDYIALRYSIAASTTGFAFDGGSIYDTFLSGTGNVIGGTTATVLEVSGLMFTGGGNTGLDADFHLTVECTSPCTAGTLVNVPAGYEVLDRGSGIIDSSGLLTKAGTGTWSKIANFFPQINKLYNTSTAGGNPYFLLITNPTVARNLNIPDPGANASFVFDVAPQILTNKTSFFGAASLAAQTGSVATANLVATAPIGEYLIQIYMPSTVACGTPGPAQVVLTIGWTDETGARTQTFTQPLGTTTGLTNSQIPVWVNAAANITYATAYTNCTAGTATYALRLSAAKVQ